MSQNFERSDALATHGDERSGARANVDRRGFLGAARLKRWSRSSTTNRSAALVDLRKSPLQSFGFA
ncbi:hypothetical protein [Novosphingobium sp. BL-52-GroH]|uniref:hypothetical protein n=1 Tax=Novosphingobium sp. BL-52-GroH TaxID=3349877 RepID=UPI00384A6EFF